MVKKDKKIRVIDVRNRHDGCPGGRRMFRHHRFVVSGFHFSAPSGAVLFFGHPMYLDGYTPDANLTHVLDVSICFYVCCRIYRFGNRARWLRDLVRGRAVCLDGYTMDANLTHMSDVPTYFYLFSGSLSIRESCGMV